MNKKLLSIITALVMCSSFTAAVYADENDTADVDVTISAPSEDISGETPDDVSEETSDDISEDTPDDTVEDTDNVIETEDDIYVPEDSTDAPAEDVTDSAYTELTDDEEDFLLPAWVQSWDSTNGVLTLQGQLPDTYYESGKSYGLATLAGIEKSAVKKIVITSGVKAGSSAEDMFWDMNNLTQIQGLSNIDTSNVTNMGGMFSRCSALTSLDLSKFDTSNVTDMRGMFYECSALTSLNISKFDTSNVTDMSYMFYDCSSLISLDLSKFDTSKVNYMSYMFSGCTKLTTIKVSDKWSTSAVTDSINMFTGSTKLKGGAGTVYNSSKVDQTYARIDKGTSAPGYLSSTESTVRYDASSQTLILKAGSVLKDDIWACRDNNNVKHIVAEQGAKLPADSSQLFTDFSSVTDIDLSKADTSAVTDMSAMFIHCKAVTKIDLTGFNTSKVTNMEYMFSDCQALTSLDISMFDTSKVTTMKRMFYRLNNIKNIDLSNFDTSGVENMEGMFASCTALASVDLSKLNTSKVTKMGGVFSGCSALTSLDLTSFDTSNVTDMKYMFNGCTKLTTIKVSSKWTTSAVTDSQYMFTDSTKLRGGAGTAYNSSKTDKTYAHIDGGTSNPGYLTAAALPAWVKSWDAANGVLTLQGQLPETYNYGTDHDLAYYAGLDHKEIKTIIVTPGTKTGTSANDMFNKLENLIEIQGLSNLDTSSCTNMKYMFCCCSSLTSLDLSKFDTSKVQYMGDMFTGCSALTSLDLSKFDTSNVTDMSGMFYKCNALTSLDMSKFNTSNVTDMRYMFYNCSSLTSLDLSKFDTSKVTDMSYMFYDCSSLSSLDLSKFDTSKVTNMNTMFLKCYALTSLDLSKFDTSNVTDMRYMFASCTKLTTIKVSDKWTVSRVTTSNDMFYNCTKLKGGAGTVFNSSNIDKTYARIDKGTSAPGYFTAGVAAPAKPTVIIKTAFGGKTVQFNCTDPEAEIYYQTGSSNITASSKHVKAGTTVFFNTPMTGKDAAIYFKAYKNGKWSVVGKWGLLNVKIDKPIITPSGKASENNFKVYTQTKNSYIIYTLDGSVPSINEGTQKLTVKNGKIVWGTSAVINIPKGKTIKAIAIRNGLVTSDVVTYTNK